MRGLVIRTSAVRRTLAAALVLGAAVCASGCLSFVPLQTASVVDEKALRLGAQASATPYCTVTTEPLQRCALVPAGIPLPELRASARYGIADRTDLGVSLGGSAVVPVGVSTTVSVDGKRELWSRPLEGGGRQLVAASVGVGGRFDLIGGGATGSGSGVQVSPEVSVPVAGWYGHTVGAWELYASPRFVERVAFVRLGSSSARSALHAEWLGAAVGAVSGGRLKFAVALEYLAPVTDLSSGPLTLSGGILFDAL